MDVVEIARERRKQLHAELGRLDEFVRTAESLLERDRQAGVDENRRRASLASADFAKRG